MLTDWEVQPDEVLPCDFNERVPHRKWCHIRQKVNRENGSMQCRVFCDIVCEEQEQPTGEGGARRNDRCCRCVPDLLIQIRIQFFQRRAFEPLPFLWQFGGRVLLSREAKVCKVTGCISATLDNPSQERGRLAPALPVT
jgi:hypothetical protein